MNIHPYRQVHLDFHTSPDIPGIGSGFSKENFQEALKRGNVDSITVFAKCHHGLCYYPTKVGTMHPKLSFDLTGAMVDAAHEIGVKAPIYITAGWSDLDAVQHPEWIAKDQDGKPMARGGYEFAAPSEAPKPYTAWQILCLNDNSYARHIYRLTEEICQRYPAVDGLFYDITVVGDPCYCDECRAGMAQMGLDPDKDGQRYFVAKRQVFMQKCNEILQRYHPGATIFFNSGGANIKKPQYHALQSHFEMEDLPTAWDGYNKLPLRAKFFKETGKHIVGMTGKFHLDWGEFGGFKTKEALCYEIATMALFGAAASVGDHMHPDGEMELQTYETIGYAYDYLERIAPYCYGGESMAKVGLWLSRDDDANEGVSNILVENQMDYDLANAENLQKFAVVILPGKTVPDHASCDALRAYLDRGGKLLFMADALVKDGKFQLDLGFEYIDAAEFDCDYLLPAGEDAPLHAPMLCYFPGHRVRGKGQVLAHLIPPYFSRTYGHFCGHKNTPHDKDAAKLPAVIQNGNVVYLAHDLPRNYFVKGSVYHKRWFMQALNAIFEPDLKVSGLGAQGRIRMIDQIEQNRFCINMTYASPVRRGEAEIIEDIMPIYHIGVQLKTHRKIRAVRLPLTGETLAFLQNEIVSFTIPELHCHTTVILEY